MLKILKRRGGKSDYIDAEEVARLKAVQMVELFGVTPRIRRKAVDGPVLTVDEIAQNILNMDSQYNTIESATRRAQELVDKHAGSGEKDDYHWMDDDNNFHCFGEKRFLGIIDKTDFYALYEMTKPKTNEKGYCMRIHITRRE